MFKVRDWLYISDYPTAKSAEAVKNAGIQAMLQLFEPIEMPDIEHEFIGVHDVGDVRPEQIEKGVAFIRRQHAKGHRLLIACGAGISRSVMFSIIALKEIEGLAMPDAYRAIRQVHTQAMPDHIHWKNVSDYYGETSNFWKIWGEITLEDMD